MIRRRNEQGRINQACKQASNGRKAVHKKQTHAEQPLGSRFNTKAAEKLGEIRAVYGSYIFFNISIASLP
jgi:hypothetical protein